MRSDSDSRQYVTLRQAERDLPVSRRVLGRAVHAGEIQGYCPTKRAILVDLREVAAWIRSKRVRPKGEAERNFARRRAEEAVPSSPKKESAQPAG